MSKKEMPLLPRTEQRQCETDYSYGNSSEVKNQSAPSVKEAAFNFLSLGFSVIPTNPTKEPSISSWKQYQNQAMSLDDAERIFAHANSFGLVCGSVSGNLECLDFDKPDLFAPFMEMLEKIDSGLKKKLVVTQTQSGGNHIIYRCEETVGKNSKLAVAADGTTWIETRGEGGYFLTAPSPGYKLVIGSFDKVPILTSEERNKLISLAISFTEKPECVSSGHSITDIEGRPGDLYNENATKETWKELLLDNGWSSAGRADEYGVHLTRPGKDSGTSATWRGGYLYVFSTNTGIPVGSHSAFSVYAHMKHNGDYSAAASAIKNELNLPNQSRAIRTRPEDWPDPLPITQTTSAGPYPTDALPSIVKKAVVEVQDFVQAPMALVASSALGAVSIAVQGHVDVSRAESLTGPVSLYLLSLADSGERKSTCDKYFTRAIKKYQKEQECQAELLLKQFNSEHDSWKAKHDSLLKELEKTKQQGEPTDAVEKDLRTHMSEKPKEPRLPKLIRGDETPESLAWSLANEWPTGGVISSEAGVVFGGHGMKKDSLMSYLALLNVIWDGGEHSVGRKTSESFTLRDVRLTVALQVQEPTLNKFIESSGDLARGTGFLARFLIAWPDSTQGTRLFKEPPKSWPELSKFEERIDTILNMQINTGQDDGGLEPKMLHFSDDAYQEWKSFHDDVELELIEDGTFHDVRDVASKAADNVARLSGLFHVFNDNALDTVICKEDVISAGKIVLWHLNEADRFLREVADSQDRKDVVKLDAWLLKQCQGGKTSKIPYHGIQQYGPNATRKKGNLEPVLDKLVALERLQVLDVKGGKVVEINPNLLNSPQAAAA
uniref:DUF3987 domain-containing protein n=1 Tax=Candidatus Electrothrix sp. TaxID=2170559 RepID=UPI00405777DE